MKEQLAKMTIIELVRTAHSYSTSIKQTGVYSELVREMASRLEALNLAHIGAMAALSSTQKDRDQLAAECAVLKSAFNPKHLPEDAIEILGETAKFDHDSNESGEWCWVDNEDEVIRAVLDVIRTGTETPATDRFLAEQRAQGVDMFAANEMEWAAHWEKHGVNDGSVSRCIMVAQDAKKFAAQLRNEVKV